MKVKYKRGDFVKDVFGRARGKVDKINTEYNEPFYKLKNGRVFWESELKRDEEGIYEQLKELLDELE